MRKLMIASAAALAMAGMAACTESPQDAAAEKQADSLENQANNTPNEATEQALNEKADMVEQQAGNADGGMTTENTPNSSPTTATKEADKAM